MQALGNMLNTQIRAVMNDDGSTAQRTPDHDDDAPEYDLEWEQLDLLEKGQQSLHMPNLYK